MVSTAHHVRMPVIWVSVLRVGAFDMRTWASCMKISQEAAGPAWMMRCCSHLMLSLMYKKL